MDSPLLPAQIQEGGDEMRIFIMEDYAAMSRKAAELMAAQILLHPDSVLGLATGSTPVGLYRCLVERFKAGELDFSGVKSVNLDEYLGLPAENSQSYRYFMNRNLFQHVNINMANTHVPDGLTADPEAECVRYDELIRRMGGIDMQLLGIGSNGHIGFNEPADSFPVGAHCVDLAESTIQANARFFPESGQVPRQALTMGIGQIMQARRVLILASGREKKAAVRRAFWGPVTPEVPASILQLHPDLTLVMDRAAAG